MSLPTEPIGSLPRPAELLDALELRAAEKISEAELTAAYQRAIADSVTQLERLGSPVIVDGEQSKPSFVTYPLHGLHNLNPDGVVIPFVDGHTRQLPTLTAPPFKYNIYSGEYVKVATRYATKPLKQAVIAASAISLIYPQGGIEGYSEDEFLNDLVREGVRDIRSAFESGAELVQIDFTEGRLAVKLDPSKQLLKRFVAINNRVLSHFSAEERSKIGIHTCPGGDQDSTHSADVDYCELLPLLLEHTAGIFYFEMAGESEPRRALEVIRDNLGSDQRAFIGVVNVIDPRIESAEEVCERILQAAEYIPLGQLGTTDDCGFAPFGDDRSTSREKAFAKIEARLAGNKIASEKLGV